LSGRLVTLSHRSTVVLAGMSWLMSVKVNCILKLLF
jgi:hypothetical protein